MKTERVQVHRISVEEIMKLYAIDKPIIKTYLTHYDVLEITTED